MAYQIDKFNGTFLVSIDDQTINTTATDLRLVGRNYAGYGEIQNENFVHLMENFAVQYLNKKEKNESNCME